MPESPKISPENFFGIKSPKWWFQESPGVFQLCYPWAKGFTQIEKYYQQGYGIIVIPMKKDYAWQVLEIKRSLKLASYILEQHQKNPSFIKSKIGEWKERRERLFNICQQIEKVDLSSLKPPQLWKVYNHIYQSYTRVIIPGLIIECFEPWVTAVFLRELSRKGLDPQKLSLLEQPAVSSFLTSERKEFLRLCLLVFSQSQLLKFVKKSPPKDQTTLKHLAQNFPDFFKKLKKHSNKFFWIRNNYKDIQYLSSKFYLKLLQEEIKTRKESQIQRELLKLEEGSSQIKKKKQKLIKEFNLDPQIVSTYKLLETIAWWQDERKKTILIVNHYINKLLSEMAKRTSLSLPEIQYTYPGEIKNILLEEEIIDKKALQERRRFSIWIGKENQEYWLTGRNAQQAWKVIFLTKTALKKAISGIPASPGRVIGKVRIVLDPQKDKFLKGEILVTSMTRPEFIPLMRKARGVVTNEGGITCHAAIISRELNIPCIVGTKVATKFLKNGEKVLLRAHRGTVEKLD